jgi:excisionase family DNA binding protein
MPTEFLTVREVAERLKLNPQTVRRWIRAGLLPASRTGRRQWRVRVEDAAMPAEREGRDLVKRRAAVARIREIREELRRQGVRIDAVELVRESRRELEERGTRC